jgi:hypothetical protein
MLLLQGGSGSFLTFFNETFLLLLNGGERLDNKRVKGGSHSFALSPFT